MEPLSPYLTGFLGILLFSAFVKILTTLSILRYGIGLNSSGFGMVIVLLSFALTLFVMSPQIDALGGMDLFAGSKSWPETAAVEKELRPFMEKNADPRILNKLEAIAERLKNGSGASRMQPVPDPNAGEPALKAAPRQLPVLAAAFLISELRDAFQMGFLFLIPFLVIDLLVTNVLLALGVVQISQAVVALPLKILLFFAVDGWALVSEKLVSGYL